MANNSSYCFIGLHENFNKNNEAEGQEDMAARSDETLLEGIVSEKNIEHNLVDDNKAERQLSTQLLHGNQDLLVTTIEQLKLKNGIAACGSDSWAVSATRSTPKSE